mmetsp:Transcript_72470/g.147017  ORF Transcript_72470/g.147017 Transcript_72470/m.147017 type:complete len:83 (-) Transcript_72470:107-355(-)
MLALQCVGMHWGMVRLPNKHDACPLALYRYLHVGVHAAPDCSVLGQSPKNPKSGAWVKLHEFERHSALEMSPKVQDVLRLAV